jgi:hypothetical protein
LTHTNGNKNTTQIIIDRTEGRRGKPDPCNLVLPSSAIARWVSVPPIGNSMITAFLELSLAQITKRDELALFTEFNPHLKSMQLNGVNLSASPPIQNGEWSVLRVKLLLRRGEKTRAQPAHAA